MRQKTEITDEIKELQYKKDSFYKAKKEAKDDSVRMSMIDSRIEKFSAQIYALEWVLS